MKVILILFGLITNSVVMAKTLSQSCKSNSFEEAKKNECQLKFTVESTKVGLFSSDVDGYVKDFELSADYDEENQILRNMKVIIKAASMDSDSEDRDKKLHNLCMEAATYPTITISVAGPLFLKSFRKERFPAVVNIRGKDKSDQLELQKELKENKLKVYGKTVWSLKAMEIPDPSIAVAKLSDEIRISFSVLMDLTSKE